MQAFSVKATKLGIGNQNVLGPTRAQLVQILERHGLNLNLNKRRKTQIAKLPFEPEPSALAKY
jgi:hypothetical protein